MVDPVSIGEWLQPVQVPGGVRRADQRDGGRERKRFEQALRDSGQQPGAEGHDDRRAALPEDGKTKDGTTHASGSVEDGAVGKIIDVVI